MSRRRCSSGVFTCAAPAARVGCCEAHVTLALRRGAASRSRFALCAGPVRPRRGRAQRAQSTHARAQNTAQHSTAQHSTAQHSTSEQIGAHRDKVGVLLRGAAAAGCEREAPQHLASQHRASGTNHAGMRRSQAAGSRRNASIPHLPNLASAATTTARRRRRERAERSGAAAAGAAHQREELRRKLFMVRRMCAGSVRRPLQRLLPARWRARSHGPDTYQLAGGARGRRGGGGGPWGTRRDRPACRLRVRPSADRRQHAPAVSRASLRAVQTATTDAEDLAFWRTRDAGSAHARGAGWART
jgi:hypothetical protein